VPVLFRLRFYVLRSSSLARPPACVPLHRRPDSYLRECVHDDDGVNGSGEREREQNVNGKVVSYVRRGGRDFSAFAIDCPPHSLSLAPFPIRLAHKFSNPLFAAESADSFCCCCYFSPHHLPFPPRVPLCPPSRTIHSCSSTLCHAGGCAWVCWCAGMRRGNFPLDIRSPFLSDSVYGLRAAILD
jgi:hypothetical protein